MSSESRGSPAVTGAFENALLVQLYGKAAMGSVKLIFWMPAR